MKPELHEAAIRLIEAGYGERAIASKLGVTQSTADRWLYAYRAVGKEAMFSMTYKAYDHATKVAAASDVVDRGMTKADAMAKHAIRSKTSIDTWCRLYREGGPGALEPKKRGPKPEGPAPRFATREEELEARVRELELELEIQKRINALADGRKPR